MFLRTQVITAGNHVLAPRRLREYNDQALALMMGMARTRPSLRKKPLLTLSVQAGAEAPLDRQVLEYRSRTCALSRMIIYKHMRLLLLHFNSGRIPCWSPTRAAP